MIGCITLGILLAGEAEAAEPVVTIDTSIKAGRYYMNINGVRKKHPDNPDNDQWWGLSTTAEAAALQWAFTTGEVVIIEQPDITVTASYTVVVPDVTVCPELPEPEECPVEDPVEDPVAELADVLLTWSKPVEREDETPLDGTAIAGYSVMMNEVVIGSVEGGVVKYLVEDLTPGVYRFSIATLAEELGKYSSTIELTVGE